MRNCETHTDRPLTAGRANAVLMLLAAIVLGGAGSVVRADEPDAADKLHAQKVAITVCGTCHGPQGNNTQPKFPRLAGQNPNYLAAQLKGFRSQARGDPDAISYMWGMAAELDDDTIAALAALLHGAEDGIEPGRRCRGDRARTGDLPERYQRRGRAGLQLLSWLRCTRHAGLSAPRWPARTVRPEAACLLPEQHAESRDHAWCGAEPSTAGDGIGGRVSGSPAVGRSPGLARLRKVRAARWWSWERCHDWD
jgi:cytochrome c553